MELRSSLILLSATRGVPQALQIADRWHIIHNVGEALEKVLARHHADLKRMLSPEEEPKVIAALDQQALARAMVRSQAEQLRQARQEHRQALFTRVQELSQQGWSGASIARMLGIHKKTAVKYAQAQAFVKMLRSRNASAFQPWLEEAARSGIPEPRTFAAGIKRDQAAILAALTYTRGVRDRSKGRFIVSSCSNANPMVRLDLICCAIASWLGLLELSTEDDAEPPNRDNYISDHATGHSCRRCS